MQQDSIAEYRVHHSLGTEEGQWYEGNWTSLDLDLRRKPAAKYTLYEDKLIIASVGVDGLTGASMGTSTLASEIAGLP